MMGRDAAQATGFSGGKPLSALGIDTCSHHFWRKVHTTSWHYLRSPQVDSASTISRLWSHVLQSIFAIHVCWTESIKFWLKNTIQNQPREAARRVVELLKPANLRFGCHKSYQFGSNLSWHNLHIQSPALSWCNPPTEEGRIRGCLDNGIKLWNMRTICKLLRLRETKLFLFSFPKPLMVIK